MKEKVLQLKNKLNTRNPFFINPKSNIFMQIRYILSTPFIYGMILPMIIFHIFIEIYHRITFTLYDIEYVDYRKHFVFNRHKIKKIDKFQRFNCIYCEYGNGLASYVKEIIGKTELYWCPIKNGRLKGVSHRYYDSFMNKEEQELFEENREYLRSKIENK